MTLNIWMKFIFLFSILNLSLEWGLEQTESVAECVAEYIASFG